MDLTSLFLSAFGAATLLPGGSEVVLVYLKHSTNHGFWTLLAVAAAGNTLGGMTSYLIGRFVPRLRKDNRKLQVSIARIKRYGAPVLLLSWVPVIGDVLCVGAGWLRISWLASAIFIGIGKTLRYAVVMVAF